MAREWYCRIGGKTHGPLRVRELRVLAETGTLASSSLVRQGPDGSWLKAKRLVGIEFAKSQSRPDYFVRVGERKYGPLSASRIRKAVRSGRLGADDLACRAGAGRWTKIADVPRLIPRPQKKQESAPADPSVGTGIGTVLILSILVTPFLIPDFGPALNSDLAVVAAVCGLLLSLSMFWLMCRPQRSGLAWGGVAGVFSGVFGATSLLQFIDFAQRLMAVDIGWRYAPLRMVQGIGRAYDHVVMASDPTESADFWFTLQSSLLSVGLCEEILKLLPVGVVVAMQVVDRRGALFVGAVSGLCFGIAEGLWISFGDLLPTSAPLSQYITRFVGCAGAHASMTLVAASIVLILSGYQGRARIVVMASWTLLAAAMVAVPHALYDTFLSFGLNGLAGLTMLVIMCGVARAVTIARRLPTPLS